MGSETIKVAYLNFSNAGGMLHYVINLGVAASAHVDACFVDVGQSPTFDYAETGFETLFYNWPKAYGLKQALIKYNPINYVKLANSISASLKPDIVHITSNCIALLALVASLRRLGIKVVFTLHDPNLHEEKRTLWGTIHDLYQNYMQLPLALRLIDSIHVHSTLHKTIIQERFGKAAANKTYVVQHGAGFTPKIQKGGSTPHELKKFIPGTSLVVLFFGRIEPYKGLAYLIDAHKKLLTTGADITLIIAGNGELPENFTPNDKTLVINRFIKDEEIKAIFNLSHIVALPYISATQSGVVPMAYSLGKPVICTNVGALPDIINSNSTGFLVDKESPTQISEAITRMYASPELLKSMSVNAYNYYINHLSWEHVINQHIYLYNMLYDE